ncbi:hypothetical protein KP509_32G007100 [Ceratopteris richardii]|uniref:Mitochondrial ATP synthase subunit G protein n=1 Tax=Ceratopteris richardii TaxID=49495 RepID=A0A8T2QSH8_CERRI|nr:hypothetical protein KP509_32G007100 [Ceratopteris richardii]KAH7286436.1 hypothetical protein KP509_32G007100 [Ceratopteris richardii]KAH7286437.1 hypothetical protein KP509_32G007100 [Ceratopteris richardii]
MGTYLKKVQSKAAVASQIISTHGSSFYKNLLETNKEYIVKEPTMEKCKELSRRLFFTRLASIPVRYEAFWKEFDYLKVKLQKRQDLTVEEAGIAVLFAAECYAWFVVGEIVGRGFTFTGYYP